MTVSKSRTMLTLKMFYLRIVCDGCMDGMPGSTLRSHALKRILKKDPWEYSGIFQYSSFFKLFVEARFFWNIPEYSIFVNFELFC